jgi:hypothetical protein
MVKNLVDSLPIRVALSLINGISMPVADQLKFYDVWGSEFTYTHYAVGWAWALDTPFKWTKQVPSFFGRGLPTRVHVYRQDRKADDYGRTAQADAARLGKAPAGTGCRAGRQVKLRGATGRK